MNDKSKWKPRVAPVSVGLAALVFPIADRGLHIVGVVRADGTIGLPGGKIEAGETTTEGIRREVWEEVGLKVTSPLDATEAQAATLPSGDVQSFRTKTKAVDITTVLVYDPQVIPASGFSLPSTSTLIREDLVRYLTRDLPTARQAQPAHAEQPVEHPLRESETTPVVVPLAVYLDKRYAPMFHSTGQWLDDFRRLVLLWLADDEAANTVTRAPVLRITGAGGQATPSDIIARMRDRLYETDPTVAAELALGTNRQLSGNFRVKLFLVPGPARNLVEAQARTIQGIANSGPRFMVLHRTCIWYPGDRIVLTYGDNSDIIASAVIEDD